MTEWNTLVFCAGNIFTGSDANTMQDNFTALAQGALGAPAIAVNSFIASGVGSIGTLRVASDMIVADVASINILQVQSHNISLALVASVDQLTVDSGLTADTISTTNLNLNTFSRNESGYTYLPNGLIMQWLISTSATATESLAFPLTFPNSVLSITGTAIRHTGTALINITSFDINFVRVSKFDDGGTSLNLRAFITAIGW